MKRVLVFPDVHGRDFDLILVDAIEEVDRVIFLGDYWDSFDVPLTHQLSVFQNIIDFKRSFPEKITLLLGNHDVQYMNWLTVGNVNCSGKQDNPRIPILMKENEELFEFATFEEQYLFSHAGVSKQWLNILSKKYGELKDIEEIVSFMNSKPRELFWIGDYNGGLDQCDGPLWARPYDNEFPEEFIQVVGHTFSIYSKIYPNLHIIDRGFPTLYII